MIKLIAFIISTVYCCGAVAETKIFVDPLYRATESAKNFTLNPGDTIPFQLFRNEFEDAYEVLYKKNGYLDIYVASENDINTGTPPSILNKTLPNCQVPDDWLLTTKRPLLHSRQVLQAVVATWQSSSKEPLC